MNNQLMKCGHIAQGVNASTKEPWCAICNCGDKADQVPDLTGRKARCFYGCGSEQDSDFRLAFFEHRPEREKDEYYCGCKGWD